MDQARDWTVRQLTFGSDRAVFHSHAYYDIPVFDRLSRTVVGHQLGFTGRDPEPSDTIEIGTVDLDGDGRWRPVGESRAWSWQQGAMSQWLPGRAAIIWNDRDGEQFVSRIADFETGGRTTLPLPVYAVHPDGKSALSLNMARLQHVRPGYGYAGGSGARIGERHPKSDGVWRMDLASGEARLSLSLGAAVSFLMSKLRIRQRLGHVARRYVYWFNHVKIAPAGDRFTVKLRWRQHGGHWDDSQGVSLTCGVDGTGLRLLADATSHVIWLDDHRLYFWRHEGLYLYEDAAPRGRCLKQLAPNLVKSNVHMRHFPDSPALAVFDTPYREEIDLTLLDMETGSHGQLARFVGHRPENGNYRCDLHPNLSADGRKILVSSLQDGGRQMYVVERSG